MLFYMCAVDVGFNVDVYVLFCGKARANRKRQEKYEISFMCLVSSTTNTTVMLLLS